MADSSLRRKLVIVGASLRARSLDSMRGGEEASERRRLAARLPSRPSPPPLSCQLNPRPPSTGDGACGKTCLLIVFSCVLSCYLFCEGAHPIEVISTLSANDWPFVARARVALLPLPRTPRPPVTLPHLADLWPDSADQQEGHVPGGASKPCNQACSGGPLSGVGGSSGRRNARARRGLRLLAAAALPAKERERASRSAASCQLPVDGQGGQSGSTVSGPREPARLTLPPLSALGLARSTSRPSLRCVPSLRPCALQQHLR